MENSLNSLRSIYSNHLWLEISEEDLQQAEAISQNYSNSVGKYQCYLNYLVLKIFLKWIQDYFEEEDPKIQPRYEKNTLLNLWEFINGSLLTFNSKKLILIPSETDDIEGFEVDQEWVNIPIFAADYYLPVQVNLKEKYLHLWGFISHDTLIKKGDYDPIYRRYLVDGDLVIEDLDLESLLENSSEPEKKELAILPPLQYDEAQTFIKTLSQPSPYSPRLNLKFEQWGALLSDSEGLQDLYIERLLKSKERPLLIWLEGLKEGLYLSKISPNKQKYRSAYRFRGLSSNVFNRTQRSIEIQNLLAMQNLTGLLSNLSDEDALLYSMMKSSKNFSGQAARIFWSIVSGSPPTETKQVITLEMELEKRPILLKVATVKTPSQKIVVLVRVYPQEPQSHLPPNLHLIGVDANGNPIPKLEAMARSQPLDAYIQLYFTADMSDGFGCRISLENSSITEYFIV